MYEGCAVITRGGSRWGAFAEYPADAAPLCPRHAPTPRPSRRAYVSRLRIAGFKPFADPGQCHDVTRSHKPIDGFEPDVVITDKKYDVNPLRGAIRDVGTQAVMPPRSTARHPRLQQGVPGSATGLSGSSASGSSSVAWSPATTSSCPTTKASFNSRPSQPNSARAITTA